MIASPRLRSRSTIAKSRSASCSESELVGSSKTMTRALETRARATSTSCWAPDAQVADRRLGPDVGMFEQREGLGHEPAVLAAADEPGPNALLAEHDVGLDGQVRRQGQLLIDHGHAARPRIARTAGRVGLTRQRHRARVGPMRAAEGSS